MRPSGKYVRSNNHGGNQLRTVRVAAAADGLLSADVCSRLRRGQEKRSVQDNSPASTLTGADDADRTATKADLTSNLAKIEV